MGTRTWMNPTDNKWSERSQKQKSTFRRFRHISSKTGKTNLRWKKKLGLWFVLSFQLEGGMGLGKVWKGVQGNFGGRCKCFVLRWDVDYTSVSVKNLYLRFVHFTVCRWYLKIVRIIMTTTIIAIIIMNEEWDMSRGINKTRMLIDNCWSWIMEVHYPIVCFLYIWNFPQ